MVGQYDIKTVINNERDGEIKESSTCTEYICVHMIFSRSPEEKDRGHTLKKADEVATYVYYYYLPTPKFERPTFLRCYWN